VDLGERPVMLTEKEARLKVKLKCSVLMSPYVLCVATGSEGERACCGVWLSAGVGVKEE